MKFEGYDADGNIITRNGSTVKAVYDYGGDLSSITVTYKDKNGETNTVEDISIHDAKSTSNILEYLGIDSSENYYFNGDKEYIDKINKFNSDEYALKGENSYFIIPVQNNFSILGVSYKKLKYEDVKKMYENNDLLSFAKSVVEGIF